MFVATGDIAYNVDVYDAIAVDENDLVLIRDGRHTVISRFSSEEAAGNAYAMLTNNIAKGEKVVWV